MNARISRLLPFAVSLALACFAAGCSGSNGAISVDAAGGTLSDRPDDFLFTVKLDEARTEGYALEGLAVKIKPESGDIVTVACTPKDSNVNLYLDQGEALACSEAKANAFDAKSVGKKATVQLFAKIEGKDELVGEATWTPK